MTDTVGYIDLRKTEVSEFVDVILAKLGKRASA